MPGPLLCPGYGETEKHVLWNLCWRRDSNRLSDGCPVQEAAAVRTPLRINVDVQGEDKLRLDCGYPECSGYCKVKLVFNDKQLELKEIRIYIIALSISLRYSKQILRIKFTSILLWSRVLFILCLFN